MWYKESKEGVMLEEGITEAGAFSAWSALATAYSNYDYPMIPFYLFYSMFGFQRIHDLAWAAGRCSSQRVLNWSHVRQNNIERRRAATPRWT